MQVGEGPVQPCSRGQASGHPQAAPPLTFVPVCSQGRGFAGIQYPRLPVFQFLARHREVGRYFGAIQWVFCTAAVEARQRRSIPLGCGPIVCIIVCRLCSGLQRLPVIGHVVGVGRPSENLEGLHAGQARREPPAGQEAFKAPLYRSSTLHL